VDCGSLFKRYIHEYDATPAIFNNNFSFFWVFFVPFYTKYPCLFQTILSKKHPNQPTEYRQVLLED